MKHILVLLICCFVCCSTTSWAQEKKGKKKKTSLKHEVGFNATQLAGNLFGKENIPSENLVFLYKFHPISKGAFRIKLGGRWINNSQTLNNTDTRINFDQAVKGKFGYEIRKSLTPKWTVLIGLDAVGSYSNNKTTFESNFDTVTSELTEINYGGSPFFGIEFMINPHIRISTELAYAVAFLTREESDTFQNFPEFNESTSNTDTNFSIESPGFIYLTMRF